MLRGSAGFALAGLWLALLFILYSPVAFLLAMAFPPQVVQDDSFELFPRR